MPVRGPQTAALPIRVLWMFAGRFLWWLITCLAVMILFITAFDFVALLGARMLGCEMHPGSCDYQAAAFALSSKPVGLAFAWLAIFCCVVLRLANLGFGPLWYLLSAVFFLAASPWLMLFSTTGADLHALLAALQQAPPAVSFIGVLLFYCAFPIEEQDQASHQWDPIVSAVALITAAAGALQAVFAAPKLVGGIASLVGARALMPAYHTVADHMARYFALGTGFPALSYLLAMIFAVCVIVALSTEGDDAPSNSAWR